MIHISCSELFILHFQNKSSRVDETRAINDETLFLLSFQWILDNGEGTHVKRRTKVVPLMMIDRGTLYHSSLVVVD